MSTVEQKAEKPRATIVSFKDVVTVVGSVRDGPNVIAMRASSSAFQTESASWHSPQEAAIIFIMEQDVPVAAGAEHKLFRPTL